MNLSQSRLGEKMDRKEERRPRVVGEGGSLKCFEWWQCGCGSCSSRLVLGWQQHAGGVRGLQSRLRLRAQMCRCAVQVNVSPSQEQN